MTGAETILWFSMAVLFGAAVCYAVRGLLGESVRVGKKTEQKKTRRRVTWALLGLSAVLFVLGAASLWGVMEVRTWYSYSTNGVQNIVIAVSSGLLVPCAVLVAIGIVGDRAKGGPRCPGCWYDMSASKDRCPECGLEIEKPSDLMKTRRRRWPIVMACVLLAASAYAYTHLGRITRVGWTGAIPTTVLGLGWRVLPESVIMNPQGGDSLVYRIEEDGARPLLLRWGTSRVLRGGGPLDEIERALTIRLSTLWQSSYNRHTGSNNPGGYIALSEAESGALSAQLLGYPMANQPPMVRAQLERIIQLFVQVGGRISNKQMSAVMEGVARGEDVPKSSLDLCAYSVLRIEESAVNPAWREALWRAFEGHAFPLGDDRLWLLGYQLGGAVIGSAPDIDRLIGEGANPDASSRLMAMFAMQFTGYRQPGIWERVWPVVLAGLDDPETSIRNWAAMQVMNAHNTHTPAERVTVVKIAALIRSDAPDRAGLIPDYYRQLGLPEPILFAIVDAMADPDPGVASRSRRFIGGELTDNGGQGVLDRVLAVLNNETISAAEREAIREELGYRLGRLIDP